MRVQRLSQSTPNAAENVEPSEKVQRSAGRVRQRVLSWAHRDSQMKAVCLGNLLSILTIGIIYVSCMLLYPYLESVCIALLLYLSLRRSKLAIKNFCFPAKTQDQSSNKRDYRLSKTKSRLKIRQTKSRNKTRLCVAYRFVLKHYKSAEAVYCLSAIISFFVMLISCLPLSLVFVEIASWTILIIFWLWLMDRGIFVHRWCGCSDNAMIASILFLMITGIVTQFLLFYVVKCSSEAIDAMFAVRAWADSIDNKEAQTLLHLPVVDHSIKMAQNYTLNILDSIGTHANTTLVAYLRNLTQSGFQYNQPLNMNLRELATEVYTHVQTLNLTDTAINTTWGAGKGLLLMIMKVLTLILMILTNMSNVFMCSTIVLLLLSSENDWLEIAIARLPAMVGHFPVQSEDISRVVEGALLLPVLTAHMRAVSTTVVLFILGSGYGNMAALVVFISTFVPILYPIVVLMPWVLAEAIMGNWYHVTALCVWGLVMLPYLESMVQTVVMKDFGQLHVNPYVTTLVMFSAWSVIGTRGIVYGPLVLLILCEITKFYYKKGDNELNFRTTTPMKKKYSDWHHIKSE